MNSGSLMFLLIAVGSLAILIIALVLIGVLSKGKKIKGGLRALVVLLSVMTCVSFIIYPFVHHNYIDINIRFGSYKGVDEMTELRIHRDSFELDPVYDYSMDGTWEIEKSELTLYFNNGEIVKYAVGVTGTKLYDIDSGDLAFRYMTGD